MLKYLLTISRPQIFFPVLLSWTSVQHVINHHHTGLGTGRVRVCVGRVGWDRWIQKLARVHLPWCSWQWPITMKVFKVKRDTMPFIDSTGHDLPECRWKRNQRLDVQELSRTDRCHRYVAPPAVRRCRRSPPSQHNIRHIVPTHTGVARGGPEGPSPPPQRGIAHSPQRIRKKYQSYSLVNLTLNMRYKNYKKISNLSSPDSFIQAQNAPKSVFGPTEGAYDALPDPLVGWGGGYPLPLPARRLRRLELGAYTAPRFSFTGPPQHKILATPVITRPVSSIESIYTRNSARLADQRGRYAVSFNALARVTPFEFQDESGRPICKMSSRRALRLWRNYNARFVRFFTRDSR